MKELITVVRDDWDHTILADQTIPFSWRGVDYEIDFCDAHAAEADEHMQRLVAVARKARRGHKRKAAPSNGQQPQPARHKADEKTHKELRDRVRAHARANGIEHSSTGILKREAVDLWLVAHPEDAEALRVTT